MLNKVSTTLEMYSFTITAGDDDDVMKEWFELVCRKNMLLRQEADKVYM